MLQPSDRWGQAEHRLVDWRRRGSLGHVLNPVRSALVRAAGAVPASARAAILDTMGADDVETKVTKALDRSTRQAATAMTVPGFLQLILGAVLLLAVAWDLIALFGPGDLPVATIEVSYLSPMPTPLVLLAGSLALSLLLGFLLTSHAAWVGRRIGADVAARVREAVAGSVATVGFTGLDTVEDARRRLASLADHPRRLSSMTNIKLALRTIHG